MKKRNKNRYELIGKQGTAIWFGDEIIAQMSRPRENHKKARANAELIVRALNSHVPMIDALRDIEARLSALKFIGASMSNDMQCILHVAREAMKQAETA